jgi:single-strand DNA-binding protein
MNAINLTLVGNLAADPELRFSSTGTPVASFTVCCNERYRDAKGEWVDGATSFARCNAFRELADHVAESFSKGDRVVATGQLRQRDYEAKDGTKRTVWEVAVSDIGGSVKYATLKIARVARTGGVPVAEDPWASSGGPSVSAAPPADEPPF